MRYETPSAETRRAFVNDVFPDSDPGPAHNTPTAKKP